MSHSIPRIVSSLLLLLLASPPLPAQNLPQQGISAGTPATHKSAKNAPTPKLPVQVQKPLLPPAFGGDPREGDIVIQPVPSDVDPAHAGVLKEDGFVDAVTARYVGAGGGGWNVQAMRFGDATGAYSAFTFYRDPAMQKAEIGDEAAGNAGEFLVRSAATLVVVRPLAGSGPTGDATKLSSAMLALVNGLPKLQGPSAVAPTLPGLLPSDGLQKNTIHYAIGPSGYHGPLPASSIDFSRDAEAATALYKFSDGADAMLTLIMLPTPQIAGSSLRTVLALPDGALHVATRRSGPLVGIVSGAGVSQPDAQRLLNQVRYVADLTIDQPQGYVSEIAKTAKLLLGIAYLTGILAVAAVVIAVFLGGGRLIIRRMRGKPDSSMNDDDFISLRLR